MTDYRALCAELAQQFDDALDFSVSSETRLYNKALVARTRAALAKQQGEGPSDQELDLVVIAIQALTPNQPDATTHDLRSVDRGREILRQSLARCGHPAPQPPAEGEVAEVAAWVRAYSDCEFGPHSEDPDHRGLYRAAELLQQQHPTPVPVSDEPWKREGWCDEDGFCWFGWAAEPYLPPDASWSFCMPSEREYHSVSLPARALPLPQGEVE